ncbi:hypothetical protein PMZ84_15300, partial [[Clostridium] symbiosum]|uniref:hypothetical protein n=1 Tax=Clostridium symbiosum TaxID=1512 RepID=UPI001A9BA126
VCFLCPAFAGLFVYIIHDLKGISYKVKRRILQNQLMLTLQYPPLLKAMTSAQGVQVIVYFLMGVH